MMTAAAEPSLARPGCFHDGAAGPAESVIPVSALSPIADFLTEFRPFGMPSPAVMSRPVEAPRFDEPPQVSDDDAGLAVEEARREGALAAESAFAEREASMRDAHDGALAEARRLWAEQEGEVLGAALTAQLAAAEERLANAVAAVLAPLLPQMLGAKAAAELRAAVQALLVGGEERPILIGGRADLVEAVQRSFPGRIAIEASESPEVTIRVGDTVIQSAMAIWAERLALEIGDGR